MPVFFGLFLCVSLQMFAQRTDSATIRHTVYEKERLPEQRFLRASGELVGAQLAPMIYNRYIANQYWARVNLRSIRENLRISTWKWDDNKFRNNEFSHPFHGSLYFNAFRTNGYSFWESVPAPFAGSLMWEISGETHPPAPNDLVNTGFGGVAMGSMTYQVAKTIIDERQRGFKRQANEILGLIINPVNGLNRIIDGRWGRYRAAAPGTDTIKPPFTGEADFGYRKIRVSATSEPIANRDQVYLRARLRFGDPFEDIDNAFDNFTTLVEIANGSINTVRVNGMIYGIELKNTTGLKRTGRVMFDYSFYDNAQFLYGAQQISANVITQRITGARSTLRTSYGIGGIVLAAVPNRYMHIGEGRDYDYGPGVSVFGGLELNIRDKFCGRVDYSGGWFHTIDGYDSDYFLNTVSSEFRYWVVKDLSLGVEQGYFHLKGYYQDFPDVRTRYPYLRMSLGYRFSLN